MGTTYGVEEEFAYQGGGRSDAGLSRFGSYRSALWFAHDCIDGRDLPPRCVVSKLTVSEVNGDMVKPLAAFLKHERGVATVIQAAHLTPAVSISNRG